MASQAVGRAVVSTTIGPIMTKHARIVLSLWEVSQIRILRSLFTRVEVTGVKITCMQMTLCTADGDDGPKPEGLIRFGVVPESFTTTEFNDYDKVKRIPHLESFALSSDTQVTKIFELSGDVLATMEADIACAPRRDARPVAILCNGGYLAPEKRDFKLAHGIVEISVEFSGVAFGL